MATIEDVGPTLSNAPHRKSVQFPSGRMLSVDSSDDGQLVFAGAFSSDLWRSEDGGESWSQVSSPQPDAGQFGVPGAIGGYCVTSVAVGPDSATVLAMVQCDREFQDAGVWRSSDRGANWMLVHSFPRSPSAGLLPRAGQLVWAPGTATLIYAAGGSSLAVSTDGGVTFTDVMPQPSGVFQPISHVAVAETPAGALRPPVVYALTNGRVFVSFDAGMTWIRDTGPVPNTIGGGVATFTSQNDRVMVVSPRSPFEVFATANAQLVPPEIWRGDYSGFAQTQASQWTSLPLPELGKQYSGNVFVAATRPGHGEALFYGPQRSKAFVAPLDPVSAADWQGLDDGQHVHIDLHGIFLSPDFAATFVDGSYRPSAGTVWMASDGGIFRSRDGGRNFSAAGSISTLSVVNIAGAALPGKGPVISLNTGDNDGFTTRDGGLS